MAFQRTVEDILKREGLFVVSDINLKVLNGCIKDSSRQGQNDLVGALKRCFKSTKRFL